MPLLRMLPEEVRLTAREFSRFADSIYDNAQRIEAKTEVLLANWEGSGRYQFARVQQANVQQLTGAADMLVELSLRLQREVEEWESTSKSL